MHRPFRLKRPIGPDSNMNLDDVLNTKRALNDLGFMLLPKYGLTPYPDTTMIGGIKAFQRRFKLREDGVMKPGGETETVLNHVLRRAKAGNLPGSGKIDRQSLFNLFDRFNAPGFTSECDIPATQSHQCCATGTCDVLP